MSSAIAEPAPDKLQVLSHQQYITPEHLTLSSVLPSPLDQFHAWFREVQGKVHEPEAMTVCTATPDGQPSARVVLFKQLDARGFVFYTNYASRKSGELSANPCAALAFYWREVHRQVRVVGRVEKVSQEESTAYFHSRPRGSQLGAWASRQSTVVQEGEVAQRLSDIQARFGEDVAGGEVPLPDFWGGWRVVPDEVEFWVGKPSRLHDRVRYLRIAGSSADAPEWKVERLAP